MIKKIFAAIIGFILCFHSIAAPSCLGIGQKSTKTKTLLLSNYTRYYQYYKVLYNANRAVMKHLITERLADREILSVEEFAAIIDLIVGEPLFEKLIAENNGRHIKYKSFSFFSNKFIKVGWFGKLIVKSQLNLETQNVLKAAAELSEALVKVKIKSLSTWPLFSKSSEGKRALTSLSYARESYKYYRRFHNEVYPYLSLLKERGYNEGRFLKKDRSKSYFLPFELGIRVFFPLYNPNSYFWINERNLNQFQIFDNQRENRFMQVRFHSKWLVDNYLRTSLLLSVIALYNAYPEIVTFLENVERDMNEEYALIQQVFPKHLENLNSPEYRSYENEILRNFWNKEIQKLERLPSLTTEQLQRIKELERRIEELDS